MCGRFVLYSSLDDIVRALDVQVVRAQWRPRYNIAPTQPVMVVLREDGLNVLEEMVWGLIPHWARERPVTGGLINARAETLSQKPSFRRAFARQRCLVVADGFYEWRKLERTRVPFYFYLKRHPFAFAGLYDIWQSPEGEVVRSCSVVTTHANSLVQPIHTRMPVILPKEAEAQWLAPQSVLTELLALLRPISPDGMEMYPVSSRVNSPAYDSPECILPVEESVL